MWYFYALTPRSISIWIARVRYVTANWRRCRRIGLVRALGRQTCWALVGELVDVLVLISVHNKKK